MNELIKAFQIFAKYSDSKFPTCCEHDILYVQVNPVIVSEEDKEELDRLGFTYGKGEPKEVFYSTKYGSC